jgi:hypothetical protein
MENASDIKIGANDLMRSMRIHVRIRGVRMLRLRLRLASYIFRFGGFIAGVPTRVKIDV